jgi:alkanesulfonate monooxygenase SsuD/methylene tetrahydromethanopterin reductase-like flavin-dependent oxidoreductase (luciferase family)
LPPIMIGGNGMNKTLPLAAQYADEWNGVGQTTAEYAERVTRLNELLEARGRVPTSVKKSFMAQILYGANDGELKKRISAHLPPNDEESLSKWFVGTPPQIIDRIGEYVEAGAESVLLMWRDLDDLDGIEHLAQNVLPHFSE